MHGQRNIKHLTYVWNYSDFNLRWAMNIFKDAFPYISQSFQAFAGSYLDKV